MKKVLSKKLKKYISSVLMVIAVLILSTVLNFFGIGEDTKDSIETTGNEIGTESTASETETPAPETEAPVSETEARYLDPEGVYTSKDDVALYIYLYGELPDNFMTKTEARKLGWESGSLEPFAPGMCIGGDRFGNYEGLLPEANGRTYKECDIDTLYAKSRGAKRIVFSNDGLIYYTEDHYESFELIYPED
jgi:guanyl-specific ribonuclease Sa